MKKSATESEVREIKIAVIGGGGVGKSCLTIKYTQNSFVDFYDPTIEDVYKSQATVDDRNIFVTIIDTAGQESYTSLRDHYFRECDGFLLVYDITSKESFSELTNDFIPHLKRVTDSDYFTAVILGNKNDRASEKSVASPMVKDYIAKHFSLKPIPFYEGSAKTGQNVYEAFQHIMKLAIESKREKLIALQQSSPRKKSKAVKKPICTIL